MQGGAAVFNAPDVITAFAAGAIAVVFVIAAAIYGPAIWRWALSAQQRTGNGQEGSSTTGAPPTAPLSFLLLMIAIVSVTVIFLFTMLLFWGARTPDNGILFDDPAQVIAALSLVFTVIATLVGTYFGIKSTSDARGTVENIATTTADAAERSTKTAVNAIVAAQTGTLGADLTSLVNSLHTAWNASDEQRVVGFFSDDAVVNISSLPPDKPGSYTGKEEITRSFVREYMPDSTVQSRNYRVEAGSVSWESTVEADRFRQRGFGPVEGTAVAVFAGRSITSLTFTLSPATQERVQQAHSAQQGEEETAE